MTEDAVRLATITASIAAAALAVAGCSAAASEGEAQGQPPASETEVVSLTSRFAGAYEWSASASGAFVDFQRLDLKGGGRYDAQVDSALVDPNVVCVMFPCALPESGRWYVYSSLGQANLRVEPDGGKPPRSYVSAKPANDALELEHAGQSTTLFKVATSTCATTDCATGHVCQMQDGAPVCVPEVGCEAVLCDAGTRCEIQNGQPTCLPEASTCRKTGCSDHVCADRDVMTTCEFRPEYACYRKARCERQPDGQCGFTQTVELEVCLATTR